MAFWKQREPVGCSVAGVWFGENFLNIAGYMADARAQVLPAVGRRRPRLGTIYSRWGVLSSDTAIAHAVATIGWMLMLASWAWLTWRWMAAQGAR